MSSKRFARERLVKTATYIANDATWVFAILVAISLVSSFFSVRYLSGIDDDLGELYEKDIRGQNYAQNAYATLLGVESALKDLALAETDATRSASADEIRSQSAALRALVLKAAPTFDSRKYKTLIARSKADVAAFADAMQGALGPAGSPAPSGAEARALLAGIGPEAAALKADLQKLGDVKRRANLAAFRAVRLQLRLSLYTTIALLALSIGVRVFLWRGKKRADAAGKAEGSEAPE